MLHGEIMSAIRNSSTMTYISRKDAEDAAKGYVIAMALICAVGIVSMAYLCLDAIDQERSASRTVKIMAKSELTNDQLHIINANSEKRNGRK